MLKLKLQYFGHLMRRVESLEKTLILGGIGCKMARASSCEEVGTTWFFSSYGGILVLRRGITGFFLCLYFLVCFCISLLISNIEDEWVNLIIFRNFILDQF